MHVLRSFFFNHSGQFRTTLSFIEPQLAVNVETIGAGIRGQRGQHADVFERGLSTNAGNWVSGFRTSDQVRVRPARWDLPPTHRVFGAAEGENHERIYRCLVSTPDAG